MKISSINARVRAIFNRSFVGALVAMPLAAFAAPMPQTVAPQQVVNRLVQEPWRFEGTSEQAASLGQVMLYQGRKPARLLIGFHTEGRRIEGELAALDADNRPMGTAPLTGVLQESGDPAVRPVACDLRVAMKTTLDLQGVCGKEMLAGHFHVREKTLPSMLIAVGWASPPLIAGDYWLTPWRD
ncbi:hypothetical protein [Kozakia baliensis]|uniref:hypothetical protein n=1 Tax=Kozakia baliensis TaxID=153496 RepID=UPI000497ECB4|nr:hypothetical protein [Kozakia baliensis]